MSFTRERKLVRDLMQVGVATCPPHASVPEVARLLQERGLEAVVVLDPEDGHALGFTGREELMRAYLRRDARSLSVSEVMREDVPQVPPDIPLETAVQLMLDRKERVFFLMHHAGGVVYPAAMISYSQVIRHLAARSEGDLEGLGVEALRRTPVEAFKQKREAALRRVHIQREE